MVSCLMCTGAWQSIEGGAAPKLKGANWFSFDEIKQMTNNFSEENELGEGGYGKVHHSTLPFHFVNLLSSVANNPWYRFMCLVDRYTRVFREAQV